MTLGLALLPTRKGVTPAGRDGLSVTASPITHPWLL